MMKQRLEFAFLTKLRVNGEYILMIKLLPQYFSLLQGLPTYSMHVFRVNPTVLGTKPKPFKGHSAVLLSDERILVVKDNSTIGDGIWFLEVGV